MENDQPNQAAGKRLHALLGWGLALLVVALAWAGAIALRGGGEHIELAGWTSGMDAGQARAAELDRPMVVLFTADWCSPCRQLKQEVLTTAQVAEQLQAGFVPVVIDLTDQSSANPNMAVASRYGVGGIPTVIAMTPEGKPIGVYEDGPSEGSFSAWLKRVGQ